MGMVAALFVVVAVTEATLSDWQLLNNIQVERKIITFIKWIEFILFLDGKQIF